jgi:hypothetical protein
MHFNIAFPQIYSLAVSDLKLYTNTKYLTASIRATFPAHIFSSFLRIITTFDERLAHAV